MIRVPAECQYMPSIIHIPSDSSGVQRRRTVHLGGDDGSGEDTAADGDHAGEGALLVDVRALNGGLGGAETQTDLLVPSLVARVLARSTDLVVQEDVRLPSRISIVLLFPMVDFLCTCFWYARSDWTLWMQSAFRRILVRL